MIVIIAPSILSLNRHKKNTAGTRAGAQEPDSAQVHLWPCCALLQESNYESDH